MPKVKPDRPVDGQERRSAPSLNQAPGMRGHCGQKSNPTVQGIRNGEPYLVREQVDVWTKIGTVLVCGFKTKRLGNPNMRAKTPIFIPYKKQRVTRKIVSF